MSIPGRVGKAAVAMNYRLCLGQKESRNAELWKSLLVPLAATALPVLGPVYRLALQLLPALLLRSYFPLSCIYGVC